MKNKKVDICFPAQIERKNVSTSASRKRPTTMHTLCCHRTFFDKNLRSLRFFFVFLIDTQSTGPGAPLRDQLLYTLKGPVFVANVFNVGCVAGEPLVVEDPCETLCVVSIAAFWVAPTRTEDANLFLCALRQGLDPPLTYRFYPLHRMFVQVLARHDDDAGVP